MSKTSAPPSSASGLAQLLKAKTEADLAEMDTSTKAELEKLAESLKAGLKGALSTIETDTKKQTNQLKKSLAESLQQIEQQNKALVSLSLKSWLQPFLMALCFFLIICGASWGLMHYLSTTIQTNFQVIDQQKKVLAQLDAKTWGLVLHQNNQGERFLIMPKSMEIEAGWTVGERPALKILKN